MTEEERIDVVAREFSADGGYENIKKARRTFRWHEIAQVVIDSVYIVASIMVYLWGLYSNPPIWVSFISGLVASKVFFDSIKSINDSLDFLRIEQAVFEKLNKEEDEDIS